MLFLVSFKCKEPLQALSDASASKLREIQPGHVLEGTAMWTCDRGILDVLFWSPIPKYSLFVSIGRKPKRHRIIDVSVNDCNLHSLQYKARLHDYGTTYLAFHF